mmetsp:Transcript_49977/g.97806  ORF Transcript_49977/g.97806 Transcript_49977/m.97806 type:complete len:543 (+) Transcript_49977:3-1631(+)|eukprot:CAMPEP_0194331320 /NCGR_PEP_ID=MMETSP0171-20130528/55154_1 /TAXON_ID=218684 /ORGANISM="Corethron pennatum, Strain L29A3" /LENGTH=542 /DNA_ID=CAMNT_0039092751 /DNA_START=74 /DNA_END=1702 /DNA_ORIENTATION=+
MSPEEVAELDSGTEEEKLFSAALADDTFSNNGIICMSVIYELFRRIEANDNKNRLTLKSYVNEDSDRTTEDKKRFVHMSTSRLVKIFCESYLSISEYEPSSDKSDAVNSILLSLGRLEAFGNQNATGIGHASRKHPPYEKLFEIFLLTDHAIFFFHRPDGKVRHDGDTEDLHIGLRTLIQIRSDLREWLARRGASSPGTHANAELRSLDDALRASLTRCICGPGSLSLRRVTYDGTPASTIEFIARREAVHPVRDLYDLRKRLGRYGKRCFALFHSEMKEPLVFVYVALLSEVAYRMEEITGAEDTEEGERSAKVAVFYSITATNPGLSGIDLGAILIKRVIHNLQTQSHLNLQQFVTLSPIPRFRKWLDGKAKLQQNASKGEKYHVSHASFKFRDSSILSHKEKENIRNLMGVSNSDAPLTNLVNILDTEWHRDVKSRNILQPILMRLAARYLIKEKYRGKPLDSVARFHIGNGATLTRLNFLADLSKKGLRNSAGMMVNYVYELDEMEANQAGFEENGTIQVQSGFSDCFLNQQGVNSKL